MKKGIWCPRHPDAKLVRTVMPEGKFDLRCPRCTQDRVDSIRTVPHFVDCITCKQPFDIGGGYILLHVCPDCLAKQRRGPAMTLRTRKCTVCGQTVLEISQPATGYIAPCGRRLLNISECGPLQSCRLSALSSEAEASQ